MPATHQESIAPRPSLSLTRVALVAFMPFVAAFFLQEICRTVTAVIAPRLGSELDLDSKALGVIASVYFLSFALAQIPIGLMLDRLGPRRTVALTLLLAAAGAGVFAVAWDGVSLMAGRALLGLGMAGCLMASFKANVLWWPREHLVLANNGVLAIGGLGGLLASAPAAMLVDAVGWRLPFLALSAAILVVAGGIWRIVPEQPGTYGAPTARVSEAMAGLREVLRSRAFWRVATASMLSQASFIAYQGLWASAWLADVDGLGVKEIANHLLIIAIGVCIGYVLIGVIADRLVRRGIPLNRIVGLAMTSFLAVQLAIGVSPTAWAGLLWTAFGFLAPCGILSFALLTQTFRPALAGRVNTSLNLMVFLSTFLVQAGIGWLIAAWPEAGGHYPPIAHRVALFGQAGLQAAALVWYVLGARPTRSTVTEPR